MDSIVMHRPRNVGWARAAALLYGDWGTSKAYVIGLALFALGFGDALGDIVDPRRDDIGLLLDAERLPKRVRPKKTPTAL